MYLAPLCGVCAWRADCQKKFSMGAKSIFCPDFTRDVSFPEPDFDISNRPPKTTDREEEEAAVSSRKQKS
jgi:hypothetical protein